MGAVCAACLRPIVGKGFVIAETEVLHTACAPRAGETVRWQQQRELARLAGEVKAITAVAQEREYSVNYKSAELERMRRERDNAREAQASARRLLELANDLRESERIATARANGDRLAAVAERDAARRESEALRREIALYRTLGPGAPIEAEPTKARDDRNPMDVRFSLLELDKP